MTEVQKTRQLSRVPAARPPCLLRILPVSALRVPHIGCVRVLGDPQPAWLGATEIYPLTVLDARSLKSRRAGPPSHIPSSRERGHCLAPLLLAASLPRRTSYITVVQDHGHDAGGGPLPGADSDFSGFVSFLTVWGVVCMQ